MKPLVSQLWPQFMADPDFAACFGQVIVEHARMLRQDRQVEFTLRSAASMAICACVWFMPCTSTSTMPVIYHCRSLKFAKKALVRSLLGLLNTSSAVPISSMTPSDINNTLSATFFANSIS